MTIAGGLMVLATTLAVGMAAVLIWRRPALAVGVFAIGLAVHNAILMVLLEAGTPALVVRGLQVWKEFLVALLLLRLVVDLSRDKIRWRLIARAAQATPGPLRVLDLSAVGFAGLLTLYLILPVVTPFGSETTVAQRLLSFRILILLPVLYGLGRFFGSRDREGTRVALSLVIAAAVLVAVVGLIDLWFVPTNRWASLVNAFTSWQGFHYRGPGGLPENFFQSTPAGFGLRRMVSTYISPLGVAYTGLLVAPVIVAGLLAPRRRAAWGWVALVLTLASIALSVTRLAVICLVVEVAVLAILVRRPRAVVAAGLAIAAAALAFGWYPQTGPLVSFDLADVRPPAGAAAVEAAFGGARTPTAQPTPSLPPGADPDVVEGILSQEDASIQAHIAAVRDGFVHAVDHPFGVGLGSTMQRFGTATGPGESALLGIVGEVGVAGGVVFTVLYGGAILAGLAALRRPRRGHEIALAALVGIGGIGLAPIVLTSAVWGDFSVTFLFWWATGALVSALVAARHGADARSEGSANSGGGA